MDMCSAAEDVVPTIQAMRRQENQVYTCIEYLSQQQPSHQIKSSSYTVTPQCREKMVEWSYKVCPVILRNFLRWTGHTVVSCDTPDPNMTAISSNAPIQKSYSHFIGGRFLPFQSRNGFHCNFYSRSLHGNTTRTRSHHQR